MKIKIDKKQLFIGLIFSVFIFILFFSKDSKNENSLADRIARKGHLVK